VRNKNVVFEVELDSELLDGLTKLNYSALKILKEDMSEALRTRVQALKKSKYCLLSLPMQ
jgi:hypothetical protein